MILTTGGNWIGTDQLLRYSNSDKWSKQRYKQELSMHIDIGFNAIRVWGGGVVEREDFYEVCDELGLLVHQDVSVHTYTYLLIIY